MPRPNVLLVLGEEDLVKLLSRSKSGVYDLDPTVGSFCETPGDLGHASGATHVEDEDLAVVADCSSLHTSGG